MSAGAVGWVFRYSRAKGSAFIVHLALADSANDMNGNELWMRQAVLAAKARLSRRSVGTALQWLVDEGYLVVLEEGAASGATNLYRLEMGPEPEPVFTPPGRRMTKAQGAQTLRTPPEQKVHTPPAESAQGVRKDCAPHIGNNPSNTQADTQPPAADAAASVIHAVYAAKQAAGAPAPAVPFPGLVKIARALLDAGWPAEEIQRAMIAVPTISTRWVEAELQRGRGGGTAGAPPGRPVDTDREAPTGRLDL